MKKRKESTFESIVTLLFCGTLIMTLTNILTITNIPWEWVLAPLWLPIILLIILLFILKYLE